MLPLCLCHIRIFPSHIFLQGGKFPTAMKLFLTSANRTHEDHAISLFYASILFLIFRFHHFQNFWVSEFLGVRIFADKGRFYNRIFHAYFCKRWDDFRCSSGFYLHIFLQAGKFPTRVLVFPTSEFSRR